jgi:hypothetical protein
MDLPINEHEHQVAFARDLSVQQSPTRTLAASRTDVPKSCLQFQFIAWTNLTTKTRTIKPTKQRKL